MLPNWSLIDRSAATSMPAVRRSVVGCFASLFQAEPATIVPPSDV
jgi:hypothetical protein